MKFKRELWKKLLVWKNKTNRKPLVLRGARQVGKTTIVHQFGKEYKHFISLNLERKEHFQYFEEENVNIKIIFDTILLSEKVAVNGNESTLLFIDEIQESPKAISLLRYFYEDLPHIHVIAAGSLLEFAMKEIKSFPVGRVEYLYLHPFNFLEFLNAMNHQQALKALTTLPVQDFAHNVLLDLFNTYTILGGMPEIVQQYVQEETFSSLTPIYESIWSSYINDVEKYGSNTTARNVIKFVMQAAPKFIDERIKYQNFANSNYRSREVSEAFLALDMAKVVQILTPSTSMDIPILPDYKKSPKLQVLDTGIVNYSLGIMPDLIPLKDLSDAYRGALIPHIFNQEIISLESERKASLSFWIRDKAQSSAEIDLILAYKGKIIPIEIKSGATGSLKSLHQFINQSEHHYAVRVYGGKFKIQKTKTPEGKVYYLMHLPYYLGTHIYQYLEYFLEKY
ncbi:MAG: AAA family ATPase [Chitinophagales bacterium]|nr:AAA family ATPase [Chitinophagales bacterium]MCZ2393507.1 AAA family ATPase [Chitinophagales bacterium]